MRHVLAACAARDSDVRIGAIAHRLAMSDRTLQRRLALEGWSSQHLVDDWRKDAAGRHVGQSDLGLAEIAYLLGYSEPAPFHRAFKRWFGVTPHRFRQQHRTG
jgi:AraC-like DNA-binding protein